MSIKTKRDAQNENISIKSGKTFGGEQKENISRTALSKIPRLNLKVNVESKLKNVKKEVPSFSTKMIPANVENIDEFEEFNKFLTPEYVNDIYLYLRWLEVRL